MEINLQNKTAWVFGGSRGIGRAIATKLAEAGANILLIARNRADLLLVKDSLCVKKKQEHDLLVVDMANTKQLGETLRSYYNVSAVDIVINNSGGPKSGPAHTAGIDEYVGAFSQHVLAAQVIASIALPIMKRGGEGRIINIISTSVKQPIGGLGVSNTVRGAMANWSKTVAGEVGGFGVTVNNILPGATKTDRLVEIISKKAEQASGPVELVMKKMKGDIPVGRFGFPEEVAYLAVFLCSKYADYINGINIPVDGGRTKSL